jgi:phosphopantothenoylcysteine decarboxylase/phosphopantothenate--cysteine ligase
METNNLLKNAREKLKAKNLDIIVANRIDEKRKAFGTKKTSVIILGAEEKQHFVNMSKEKIADILLDKIEKLWYKI